MQTTTLRTALSANAAFSTLTGVAILTYPVEVANWIGLSTILALQIVGSLLMLFAAGLLATVLFSRRPQALTLIISAADLGWVIATVAIGIFVPQMFSAVGWIVASAVALVVLGCAIGQLHGIDVSYRDPLRPRSMRLCVESQLRASASSVWQVVSDLGSIADHSVTLSSSKVIQTDPATGQQTRQCHDTQGNHWSEFIFSAADKMTLDVRFDTTQPDFPFPFSEMIGGWKIQPYGQDAIVKVWWSMVPRNRVLVFVLMPIMERSIHRLMEETLASMEETASALESPRKGAHRKSLLPVMAC